MTNFCKALLLPALLLGWAPARAQLRTIRARASSVDVRDGDLFRKGYWNISPEVSPDTYVAERSRSPRRITFYTDLDSISFETEPGKTYDFIILQNGKQALTRISTVRPVPVAVRSSHPERPDTIPFKLNISNRMILRGQINGKAVTFLFDTGANGLILSDKAGVNVHTDGQVQGAGLGGSTQDDVSRRNRIELGTISWDSVSLNVKHSGYPPADAVIGYNLFEGKVVEIDYDQELLIIHSRLPADAAAMTRYDLRFREGLSYLLLRGGAGGRAFEALYDFDTGASNSLFLNRATALEHGLYGILKDKGRDAIKGSGPAKVAVQKSILPELAIGGTVLRDIPIEVEDSASRTGPSFNILGNDVLRRFHMYVDYQNDAVYLAANSHVADRYLEQKRRLVFRILWAVGALLVILFIRSRIRRKQARLQRERDGVLIKE